MNPPIIHRYYAVMINITAKYIEGIWFGSRTTLVLEVVECFKHFYCKTQKGKRFLISGIGSPRLIGHNSYRRYVQLSPLLPFGMMLIISTIIFILIIFRRWPGLVAGIVAGCLTSISVYLLLLTLKEQRLVYEWIIKFYKWDKNVHLFVFIRCHWKSELNMKEKA